MADGPVVDWMALSFVPGLGSRGIRQLVRKFGSPAALFTAAQKGVAVNSAVRKDVATRLAHPAPLREKALTQLQHLRRHGAEAICPDDDSYPLLLSQIADPPPVLYVQGDCDLLLSPCVAMVGSRAATAYGRRCSFSLAGDLAKAGVTVVSGLALGVDAEAHSGALAAGGNTIAVLGCGLDVAYPRQNSRLFDRIRKDGLLVTEYPLGTRPDGFRFPARNRIIAGASWGVVVVEAARKSGSLITAEMALDEGREVFAVPGQIDSFKSGGTHWLLQQGAKLVQSAEDILVELGGSLSTRDFPATEHAGERVSEIDPDASRLLQSIDVYPGSRNELIAATGLGAARVTELLLLLELEGLVELLPGDEIRRIA